MVEAGGVGRISLIDNTQLIENPALTKRSILKKRGSDTRNTHTEFNRFFFAYRTFNGPMNHL